jgi:hypothetical protein
MDPRCWPQQRCPSCSDFKPHRQIRQCPSKFAEASVKDNTSNERISRPIARWFAVGLAIVFAAAGAANFISIGTRQGNLWAIVLGAFPLAAWLEAAKVRSRGNHAVANQILMTGMTVQMVLWLLAMYAADLAEASGCD